MLFPLSLALVSLTIAPGTTHRAAGAAATPMTVPFIDDDYAKAVAEARARKVPIFIEAWAPW